VGRLLAVFVRRGCSARFVGDMLWDVALGVELVVLLSIVSLVPINAFVHRYESREHTCF
jgi:hypothetical protein